MGSAGGGFVRIKGASSGAVVEGNTVEKYS